MGWTEYTPRSPFFTQEPAVLLLFFCDVLIWVVKLINMKSSGPHLMIFTNWENAARIFAHKSSCKKAPWSKTCPELWHSFSPRMPLCDTSSSLGPLHHSGWNGGFLILPRQLHTTTLSVLHNDMLIQSGNLHCALLSGVRYEERKNLET